MLRDLVLNNRSYRRFKQKPLSWSQLEALVDLARLSPSAGNLQPLRYFLSVDPKVNELIFPHLFWGADSERSYAPEKDQAPTGYIIMLENTRVSRMSQHDQGISAQTILLGAVEVGLGGCIVKTIDKDALESALQFESDLDIKLVLALGYPVEKVKITDQEDLATSLTVPKKKLSEVILNYPMKPKK